ncbi:MULTISPECIES: FKBP-type peptidyl-prolyl cis-trans isomerase [Larkinella]|jgi:peptidylprolyl isomerase|uniref:Peptidyl-prolyl cis-trans isomerase n=2 Tax=Larkinella TaxID=332157 RepID=A0A5N1JMZ2_9BACT|nr:MULTISPECIES: peptidylprolyl isomerase [Larkinella]KAA9356807.1 peptidylprolyl isomerase [Larkinella humicola]RCR66016.1 peptidylprolyl isomerase [Larkinella punicea]
MAEAKAGDTVQVHYTGRKNDGTVFDSSSGRSPLQFQVGSGMVIRGFDEGVKGMEIGQAKTVRIPVEDAYGPSSEDMIFEFDRSLIPDDIELEIGLTLNMHQDGNPQAVPVVVRNVTATSVTLDANHPLAGEELIFDIELVGINPSKLIL